MHATRSREGRGPEDDRRREVEHPAEALGGKALGGSCGQVDPGLDRDHGEDRHYEEDDYCPHLEELDLLNCLVDDRRDGHGGGEGDERDHGDHCTVLPNPKAKVRIVAPLVATPGKAFGRIAHRHITGLPGFPEAREAGDGGLTRG